MNFFDSISIVMLWITTLNSFNIMNLIVNGILNVVSFLSKVFPLKFHTPIRYYQITNYARKQKEIGNCLVM